MATNMSIAQMAPYTVIKGVAGAQNNVSATDDDAVIRVGLTAGGEIVWVDYADGNHVTEAEADFSKGDKIAFQDGVSLVNVTTYALLQLEKDGSPYFCYVKTPQWW